MAEEEETHERRFRGTWCPPELLDGLEAGDLNTVEVCLLMVVEALVNHAGEDCWASNAYLGRRVGVTEKQASRLITRLRDQGWLEQTGFDGRRRYLRTAWSRLRKNAEAASPKMRGQTTQKCVPENTKLNTTPSAGPPADTQVGAKRQIHPRWRKMAEELSHAILKVRRVDVARHIPQWAKSLELLHTVNKVDIPRIKTALRWYCENLPRFYHERYFPKSMSGHSFREDFVAGKIERAMENEAFGGTPKAAPADPKMGSGKVKSINMGKMTDEQWQQYVEENG